MVDEQYFCRDILVAMRYPWDDENHLFVFPLPYRNNCTSNSEEWEIAQEEEENEDIDKLRNAMFMAGWWWSTELPYEHHPEGGLLVTGKLPMQWEITFQRLWNPVRNDSIDSRTYSELFHPPVPLSRQPSWAKEGRSYPPGYEKKRFDDSFWLWVWE